ncbi:MAG: STAS domain-containing protein [Motiliproteus sp.]
MAVFKLPAEMGIATASELKQTLHGLLESEQCLDLDAAAVVRVDASTLQLLLALVNEADLRQLQLRWLNISAELKVSAELLGLTDSLKLA